MVHHCRHKQQGAVPAVETDTLKSRDANPPMVLGEVGMLGRENSGVGVGR